MTKISVATPQKATVGPGRSVLDWRPLFEPAIFLVLASIAFFIVPSNLQFVLTTAVIYTLVATSVGMLFGWAGIYSFGHAALFGVGAYAVALLKDQNYLPLLFLGISAVAAAIAALIVFLLGARLVNIEFAMMTLIFGQIVFLIIFKVPALGGDNGIYGISRGKLFGLSLAPAPVFWWYVVIVVAIALGLLRRMHLSPFGESLQALRDDPTKAAAIGIPVKALQFGVFVIAGAAAGLAGGLFAQQQGIISTSAVSFMFSGQLVIMALLGGIRSFWGPAVGAFVFVLLNFAIFNNSTQGTVWLGAILLVVVLVIPDGIVGAGTRLFDRVGRRKKW